MEVAESFRVNGRNRGRSISETLPTLYKFPVVSPGSFSIFFDPPSLSEPIKIQIQTTKPNSNRPSRMAKSNPKTYPTEQKEETEDWLIHCPRRTLSLSLSLSLSLEFGRFSLYCIIRVRNEDEEEEEEEDEDEDEGSFLPITIRLILSLSLNNPTRG